MQNAMALNARDQSNPLKSIWKNRRLIIRLGLREVEARYRGSVFGLFWSVLTPILMVATYAFVFTYIFQPRWVVEDGAEANFILLLYSGILIYSVFGETVGRAPRLILENVSYVKKVVFPLEILPVVSLVSSAINLLIGLVVLCVMYVSLYGLPPATSLLLPVVLLPLLFMTLGISWILAALGVYLRDLGHIVGVIVSMLMFLSPIFYPITAVPEQIRPILKASPLTPVLEASKDVFFWGRLPDLGSFGIALIVSLVVAFVGYRIFNSLRAGFADVV